MEELIQELVEELTLEFNNEPTFSEDILRNKIKGAIREVKARRNYGATSYKDEKIAEDLSENFYSVIAELARYDYATIGAEGETSHSENGVSRQFVDRDKILGRVYSFVGLM